MITFNATLERECGVVLGTNISNGKTTIMPINRKTGNMVFVGRVGSGKSFAMKMITKRLADAWPSAAIFVVDSMNEYGKNAEYYGLDSVSVGDGVPEFGDRSIISPKSQKEGRVDSLTGALEKAWLRVVEMPHDTIKVIVIDANDVLVCSPEARVTIGEIMLSGKKHNAVLLLAVQHLSDIDVHGGLKANLSDYIDTCIFMQPDAREVGIKGLTAGEVERLSGLDCGHGLLVKGWIRDYLRFVATKDQTERYFNMSVPYPVTS